jgi:rfaE bifunctional protein nucleotidyltransferase chain/domain
VATNGCFDLLHVGHLRYLTEARAFGDFLWVGLNGDASVRELKGPGRPLVPEADRAELLAAWRVVDAVTIFPEVRATAFLRAVQPDIYVKGGDYTAESLECRGSRRRCASLRREDRDRGAGAGEIDVQPRQKDGGMIRVENATKLYGRPMRTARRCMRSTASSLTDSARRICGHHGAERLRQEHAAACAGRARRPDQRRNLSR